MPAAVRPAGRPKSVHSALCVPRLSRSEELQGEWQLLQRSHVRDADGFQPLLDKATHLLAASLSHHLAQEKRHLHALGGHFAWRGAGSGYHPLHRRPGPLCAPGRPAQWEKGWRLAISSGWERAMQINEERLFAALSRLAGAFGVQVLPLYGGTSA